MRWQRIERVEHDRRMAAGLGAPLGPLDRRVGGLGLLVHGAIEAPADDRDLRVAAPFRGLLGTDTREQDGQLHLGV